MHQTKLFFLLPIELRSYTDTENSKTGSNSDSDSKTSGTAKTVIATKGDLSYTDPLILGLSNGKNLISKSTLIDNLEIFKALMEQLTFKKFSLSNFETVLFSTSNHIS